MEAGHKELYNMLLLRFKAHLFQALWSRISACPVKSARNFFQLYVNEWKLVPCLKLVVSCYHQTGARHHCLSNGRSQFACFPALKVARCRSSKVLSFLTSSSSRFSLCVPVWTPGRSVTPHSLHLCVCVFYLWLSASVCHVTC